MLRSLLKKKLSFSGKFFQFENSLTLPSKHKSGKL